MPGDTFYLQAFRDLNTCRSTGWNVGPIPWRDMLDYAQTHQLDETGTHLFMETLRAMDQAFLKWCEDNKDG